MSHGLLTFTGAGGSWSIEGQLDRNNTALLLNWSSGIVASETVHTLELASLEIVDAAGNAAAVEAIRQILQHTSLMTICHAPQLLAHTLYRIGMLEAGSQIILVEPRHEEPYG